ncbi:YveK family protein [Mesobacillus foraminis]|uniref:YveK family protein n=1 Tax=Mesobacillus foraminis TaxID=279826 RepID=UPI000EF43D99|nr:Wzz/FepE/Etk N-terminal domain-containing protein [Mesobacillus foraminis]
MKREIDLKEVVDIIRKRIWIVLMITVITTIGGAAYGAKTTTLLYQASTNIIIGADAEYMKTLQVIIKNITVLEKVVKELNLDRTPEALATQISVQSLDGSQVVSINVVDTNPELAADIANTTASVFKREIPKIVDFKDVSLLSPAKVNPYPINETQNRTIIISLIFGLAISIGLAFLLDSFDDTIRPDQDMEDSLGLPLLGKVPKMTKKNIKKKSNHQQAVNVRSETIASK